MKSWRCIVYNCKNTWTTVYLISETQGNPPSGRLAFLHSRKGCVRQTCWKCLQCGLQELSAILDSLSLLRPLAQAALPRSKSSACCSLERGRHCDEPVESPVPRLEMNNSFIDR
jgi:hypothetical protein